MPKEGVIEIAQNSRIFRDTHQQGQRQTLLTKSFLYNSLHTFASNYAYERKILFPFFRIGACAMKSEYSTHN